MAQEVSNVANHLRQRLASPESAPAAPGDIDSPPDVVLAFANKKHEDGAFVEAGAAYSRVLEKTGLPEDVAAEARQGLDVMLKTHQKFYGLLFLAQKCAPAVA